MPCHPSLGAEQKSERRASPVRPSPLHLSAAVPCPGNRHPSQAAVCDPPLPLSPPARLPRLLSLPQQHPSPGPSTGLPLPAVPPPRPSEAPHLSSVSIPELCFFPSKHASVCNFCRVLCMSLISLSLSPPGFLSSLHPPGPSPFLSTFDCQVPGNQASRLSSPPVRTLPSTLQSPKKYFCLNTQMRPRIHVS